MVNLKNDIIRPDVSKAIYVDIVIWNLTIPNIWNKIWNNIESNVYHIISPILSKGENLYNNI